MKEGVQGGERDGRGGRGREVGEEDNLHMRVTITISQTTIQVYCKVKRCLTEISTYNTYIIEIFC